MTNDLKIIIGGRVLQIVIALASLRILTTLLSPEEVGNYYVLLAFLAFFNLVLLNPPSMYLGRHLLHWKESKNLFNGIFVFIIWIVFIALLSVPISMFIYDTFDYATKFDLDLFVGYIVLAIIISTIHRNVLYGTNTLGYRKEFVIYLLITLFLGLMFSVAIVYYYFNVALGWVLGVVLAEFLILYIILTFFIQKNTLDIAKIKLTLTKERLKKILYFSLPIGVTTFLMWGQNTAYRFIVDYQYGVEILAFVAIGLGVSSAVFSSIEAIAMQYFNPIFLKNILHATLEERAKAWNDIARQIVPIYILAFFFTLTMSEVLMSILADKKFHDAYVYTMFGVGIEFFRVMTNLLNNVSQSEHKTSATIKPYFLGFSLSVGLLLFVNFDTNYVMIPLVLAIAYAAVFIYMYFNMKSLLAIEYNVQWGKMLVLSLPFFMIYLLDITELTLVYNVFLIGIFGLYFLGMVWFITKGDKNV